MEANCLNLIFLVSFLIYEGKLGVSVRDLLRNFSYHNKGDS